MISLCPVVQSLREPTRELARLFRGMEGGRGGGIASRLVYATDPARSAQRSVEGSFRACSVHAGCAERYRRNSRNFKVLAAVPTPPQYRSIDRSIDRTNERTDGRDESLVGFPITRRASSPLARGCTMVGNARRGIRALSRVSGAPRRSRARLLHYSRACFAFASLVTPWKRILRERFPLFIQHSWTIDGEKRLRSVSPYRRI